MKCYLWWILAKEKVIIWEGGFVWAVNVSYTVGSLCWKIFSSIKPICTIQETIKLDVRCMNMFEFRESRRRSNSRVKGTSMVISVAESRGVLVSTPQIYERWYRDSREKGREKEFREDNFTSGDKLDRARRYKKIFLGWNPQTPSQPPNFFWDETPDPFQKARAFGTRGQDLEAGSATGWYYSKPRISRIQVDR